MAEKEETTETKNTTTEKTKKTKTPAVKKSTFDITLINSAGKRITGSGPVTDSEIKQICRVLHGTKEPEINIADAEKK